MTENVLTHRLTRFPEGSVRELWAVSFPLMLSAMSGSLMIFFDRLILAHYNVAQMNAAASASTVGFMIQFWVIGIAAIAEVFVGQHNGAGQKHRLGEPVWQMIWFCLACSAIFLPIGFFGGPYLIAKGYDPVGLVYFKWVMASGSFMALIPAISSFFIGQGRIRFVLFCTVVGNIINVILAYAFVFDLCPWDGIPDGAEGAAIATFISEIITVSLLFMMFMKKEFRKRYGTSDWRFKWPVFWDCFKIGAPNSTGHFIEIAAWALLFQLVGRMGEVYATVMTVGQTIFILNAFVAEGLQKGVIAVASNFIGAKKWKHIASVLGSAGRLGIILSLVVAIPLVVYPDPFIKMFLKAEGLSIPFEMIEGVIRFSFIFVWLFFCLDILTWSVAGVLTAAGDTKFVMFTNATTSWFFCVLPVYILMVKMGGSPGLMWVLAAIYAFANMCLLFWRYKTGKWKGIQIEG